MSNTSIPPWLEEHCTRLAANDVELRNLNLNIRRLNIHMMQALSEALTRNHVLLIVNLTSSLSNTSGDDALEPLVTRVLPHHGSLQVLHLSYNRLVNVTSLGEALRTNTCLVELHLDYNQIDNDSAVALAQGIRNHPTLKVLNLNSNHISDRGATALGQALAHNTSLQRLSLASNEITIQGATALYQGLQSNVTLKQIHLDKNNNIPYELSQQMLYLTQANQNGRYLLRLDDNQVSSGLWPHVLAHVSDQPSMLYFFLTNKPDLVARR